MKKQKTTILIVDDSPVNRKALCDIFAPRHATATANNGKEALDYLKENTPDLIFLDLSMPVMDGYEVLTIMQKDSILKTIPVFVITSLEGLESEIKALKLGATDFVTKPFNTVTVRQRAENIIQKRRLLNIENKYNLLKKQAESQLQLSSLLNSLPSGVMVLDCNGEKPVCIYVNDHMARLIGCEPEQLEQRMNEDVGLIVVPKHRRTFLSAVEGISGDSGVKFDLKFELASDTEEPQWVRALAVKTFDDNNKPMIYIIFVDINREKEQETLAAATNKKLSETDRLLESIINNTPGGFTICKVDAEEFTEVYSSVGLPAIFGYESMNEFRKVYGNAPFGFVRKEDLPSLNKLIRHSIENGENIETSLRCCGKNNKIIWIMLKSQFAQSGSKTMMYSTISDVTKEKEYEFELSQRISFDPLTGIYNKNAFFHAVGDLLDSNPDETFTIVMLNISGFKIINEIFGKKKGDDILIALAAALVSVSGKNGLCARLESDHFVACYNIKDLDIEKQLADISEIIKSQRLLGHDIIVEAGIFEITDPTLSIDLMCDRAALAASEIKGRYHQHYAYYDDKIRRNMIREQEIRDNADEALATKQFQVYFQPVYSISMNQFVSAEALVRWIKPSGQVISPGDFISVFEENGFIMKLDAYVWEQVCIYLKQRQDEGKPDFPISVNVSRMSLYNQELSSLILELTEKYEIKHELLKLEITETAYNDNPEQLLSTVNELRDHGFPVLMDDFGSGYSSLNTLKDIPVDILKLDMKFLEGFEKGGRVGTIVTAVSRMSSWLDIPLLAEGVETSEQLGFLKSIGCDLIQGYYFARPMPYPQFAEYIKDDSPALQNPAADSLNRFADKEINLILGGSQLVSTLINNLIGALGIYEYNGKSLELIRVNDGYYKILKYTPTTVFQNSENVWNFIYPDDVDTAIQSCVTTIKTRQPATAVIRRYDANGDLVYIDTICRYLSGNIDHALICITFNDITQEVENKQRIRASEERTHAILESTNLVILEWDFIANTFYAMGNYRVYELDKTSIKNRKAPPRGFGSLIHPDDLERFIEFYKIGAYGIPSIEVRLLRKDGGYVWCKMQENPTLDENGEPVRLTSIIYDIDSEKKIQNELYDTTMRMQTILAGVKAGILLFSVSLTNEVEVIYANERIRSLLDYDREKLNHISTVIRQSLAPEEFKRLNTWLADKTDEREDEFNTLLHFEVAASYKWYTISISTVRGSDRLFPKYCAVLTDITDISETSERLQIIMNTVPSGIAMYEVHPDSVHALFLNDYFYKIAGYTREQYQPIADTNVLSTMHEDDIPDMKMNIEHSVRNNTAFVCDYRAYRFDGSIIWLNITATPMKNTNSTLPTYLAVITDTTLQKINSMQIETILQNVDTGIAMADFDAEGNFVTTFKNKQFEQICIALEEHGRSIDEIAAESYEKLRKSETPYCQTNIEFKQSEGFFTVRFTAIKGGTYIVSVLDLTQQKKDRRMQEMTKYVEALYGIYDEVFEINLANGALRTLVSRIRNSDEKTSAVTNVANWFEQYVYQDDRVKLRRLFEKRDNNKRAYEEYRMKMPDGSLRWFGLWLVNVEGDIYFAFNSDTDEKKRLAEISEKNRRLSVELEEKRRYEILAELSDTVVIEYSVADGRRYASPSYSRFMSSRCDTSKTPAVAAKHTDTVHWDDVKTLDEYIAGYNAGNERGETIVRLQLTDGSFKWTKIAFAKIRNDADRIIFTLNIVDDEIKARNNLIDISRRNNIMLEKIPVGLGVFKIDDTIRPTYITDKLLNLFGYDSKGDDGEFDYNTTAKIFEHFTPEILREAKSSTPTSEPDEIITQTTRKDGSEAWMKILFNVVKERNEETCYAAIYDITESRSNEKKRAVQDQIYDILVTESHSIIFDYNVETDMMQYYLFDAVTGERLSTVVEHYFDKLPIRRTISTEHIKQFVDAFHQFARTPGSDEIIVKADFYNIGYHWYRFFFKSLASSDGKVFRVVGKADDVHEEISSTEEIRAKAQYDSLCNTIYNKATSIELIKEALESSKENGALMMIDVDDFKLINDTLGHLFGDEFLKEFSIKLKSIFRNHDIIGRYGGDEFIVYMRGTAANAMHERTGRILDAISSIRVPEHEIACSVGVAIAGAGNHSFSHLLKQADSALYKAKNLGKNRVAVFDSSTMNETTFRTTTEVFESAARSIAPNAQDSSRDDIAANVFTALYSSTDIHSAINKILAGVGKMFGVSRAYVFEQDVDSDYHYSNTFEWCEEGITPVKENLQHVSFKDGPCAGYESNFVDNVFYLRQISEMPSDTRNIVSNQDIKSMLQYAIRENSEFRGFVGFDECKYECFWTQRQIDTLALIASIISTFLLKERSNSRALNYTQSLSEVIDCFNGYIYIVDPDDMHIKYVNRKTAQTVIPEKFKENSENRDFDIPCYLALKCGRYKTEKCAIHQMLEHGAGTPAYLPSGILNAIVRAEAYTINWLGKEMYLVICYETRSGMDESYS